MSIYLVNMPLPPSENTRLFAVRGRMVKSKEHKNFRLDCHRWAKANQVAFDQIRNELLDQMMQAHKEGKPFALRVDCYFVFYYERIFTQRGRVEGIDADNRIKPALDGLSAIMGIDDRHFFASSCEKIVTHTRESECSILKISQMSPRNLEELKNQIRKENP